MSRAKSHEPSLAALHAFGLRFPDAKTRSPWEGHEDLAVGDKTFAFLSVYEGSLHVTCKLAESRAEALAMPFAQPAGYGLGKSGWVAATFSPLEKPPLALLEAWIEESYRARASRKQLARLDGAVTKKRKAR